MTYYKVTRIDGCPSGLEVSIREEYAKTPRSGTILIDEKLITRLAEMLPVAGHIGHAMWHISNPDCEYPCASCKAK